MLNLEGIWTRYDDAAGELERIAEQPKEDATAEMQRIYSEPVREELIAQRIREIKDQGVVAAASLTPQRVRDHYETALEAGLDILVIQGTVISAEHVSTRSEPLNLKEFIREVPVPVARRRLRVLRDRAAPHAHRGSRRAGGRWPRRSVHDPGRPRDRGPAGHGHRRCRRRALAAHARDG